MLTSRRKFLKSGAMASVAAGFILNRAKLAFGQKNADASGKSPQGRQTNFEIPYEAKTERAFYFTRSTFEPYMQTEFRATVGPYKVVRLKLVKVEDRTPRPAKGSTQKISGECFALLFEASGELSTLQQTYVLEHDALGKFPLFLTPASDEEKREIFYEAIINHTSDQP